MKEPSHRFISYVLAAETLVLGVFDGQAATVTIDAVDFAQTHLQKPAQSYFGLVGNRNTRIKAQVVSQETPAVTALLSLSGQTTNLTLTGPAVLPAAIPDGPGVQKGWFAPNWNSALRRLGRDARPPTVGFSSGRPARRRPQRPGAKRTQDAFAVRTPGVPVPEAKTVTVTLSPARPTSPRRFVQLRAAA